MWGFYNARNRNIASKIFQLVKQKASTKTSQNRYGEDQFFLGKHVYSLVKDDAIIHDSYLCGFYKDSSPFPTRRNQSCFVGGKPYHFNKTDCKPLAFLRDQLKRRPFYVCPKECRHPDHLDWSYC